MLFPEKLKDWESWSRVFDSLEIFAPLTKAIFEKEQISITGKIENLTPGSNAVFKVDSYVIKIFAPKEAEGGADEEFKIERTALISAADLGVSVPMLIAEGFFSDRYVFPYLILEYIPSVNSLADLPSAPPDFKAAIVRQVKDHISKLHQPIGNIIPSVTFKNHAKKMERMNGLHTHFIKEWSELEKKQNLKKQVLVHGDLTRDNLILREGGDLTVIDFADALLAPASYEWPAVIFELFLTDKELTAEFINGRDYEEFLEELMNGLSLHLFCGDILKDYFQRNHLPMDKITTIHDFKCLLRKTFFG